MPPRGEPHEGAVPLRRRRCGVQEGDDCGFGGDLIAAVAEHAREAHGVELNQTLVDYATTRVTRVGDDDT